MRNMRLRLGGGKLLLELNGRLLRLISSGVHVFGLVFRLTTCRLVWRLRPQCCRLPTMLSRGGRARCSMRWLIRGR
jgi:hypothetical protein